MSSGSVFRVGVGGPVGSGKTALVERLVPLLMAAGRSVLVVTNDIVTREDEQHVKATLAGVLDERRIVGVETGACPHAAVREDPSLNLAVLAELEAAYPDADLVLLESGGDNLTLTFSSDKIPRKRGPGLILADLLVINKTDLAPYVGADLGVMERDAAVIRGDRPFLFTNCRAGVGIEAVADHLLSAQHDHLAADRRRKPDDQRVHAHTH